MKKQEFVQIKGLNIKELAEKAKSLKREIEDLVMDKNMKKLKDLRTISKKRREVAQVLTIMRQKEILEELESKVQVPSEGSKSKEGVRTGLSKIT